jgi:putative membrane protein
MNNATAASHPTDQRDGRAANQPPADQRQRYVQGGHAMKTSLKRTLSTLAPTALVTAVLTSPALADVGGVNGFVGGSGFGGHMGWGYGNGFAGGFMMVAFWGLLIGGVVLATRWFSDRGTTVNKPSDGLTILQERLAKGEIDPEEYAGRRKVLES